MPAYNLCVYSFGNHPLTLNEWKSDVVAIAVLMSLLRRAYRIGALPRRIAFLLFIGESTVVIDSLVVIGEEFVMKGMSLAGDRWGSVVVGIGLFRKCDFEG